MQTTPRVLWKSGEIARAHGVDIGSSDSQAASPNYALAELSATATTQLLDALVEIMERRGMSAANISAEAILVNGRHVGANLDLEATAGNA